MSEAARLSIQDVQLFERAVEFRLPFRFGAVTLTAAPQAFVRVRVRTSEGREGWGATAELLAPKWFDKRPALRLEDNWDQLRRSLRSAADLYSDAGTATPFQLFTRCVRVQQEAFGLAGDPPLVAGFGPAQLDKAILDALCRIEGLGFYDAVRLNRPGLESDEFDADAFLRSLQPARSIQLRHTIGGVDPITSSPDPVGDGLPETLLEVLAAYRPRYFKIKVGGDVDADSRRLSEIAAVLDGGGEYWTSLDGNEQYIDVTSVLALLDALPDSTSERFARSILFVEQPLSREVALEADVTALARRKPVVIDESDATLDAFPKARALGYQGVSSKSCKGLYKSLINAGRCRAWGPRYFITGEDLTTQAGLAVQQDLALANLIGVTHVERNGHHYVDGFRGAPAAEQEAFLAAHPDLYRRAGGNVRLRIEDGVLAIDSLSGPGFASGARPDFETLSDMPAARR